MFTFENYSEIKANLTKEYIYISSSFFMQFYAATKKIDLVYCLCLLFTIYVCVCACTIQYSTMLLDKKYIFLTPIWFGECNY